MAQLLRMGLRRYGYHTIFKSETEVGMKLVTYFRQ